jgi:protein dispatched 1
MLIHTRSPFLTFIGLLQIVLSFPLSYFVYTLIWGLEFFPFLNFIGVFVLFALGADDVFVAVDKWKNTRIEHDRDASVADIAAIALPDAAGAMFLTSFTTAVAFFSTAVCPVAPIKCFAIFCGLLVSIDYIMCVLLVFPALCIYDGWRERKNCCFRCHCCHSTERGDDEDEGTKVSLIHRVLSGYYNLLHATRYAVVVVAVVAMVFSAIFAATLSLPTTSEVRLLEKGNEFEKNFEWRRTLLYENLIKKNGSTAFVMWGTKPADTGDRNNPASFTQLVLDNSFEPSTQSGQIYLRDFCGKLFENEWAERNGEDCAINRFDDWLQSQASADTPDQIYLDFCGGATSIPLAESDFDACIYNWGQQDGEKTVLSRKGKVESLYISFSSRVRYDSTFEALDNEWHRIEDWIVNEERNHAPSSVSGMFFTSEDFWWYDTNGRMLNTAYFSAATASATAAVVILLFSKSIVLTIFSTLTIAYVLASVAASVVALGWTLGL